MTTTPTPTIYPTFPNDQPVTDWGPAAVAVGPVEDDLAWQGSDGLFAFLDIGRIGYRRVAQLVAYAVSHDEETSALHGISVELTTADARDIAAKLTAWADVAETEQADEDDRIDDPTVYRVGTAD